MTYSQAVAAPRQTGYRRNQNTTVFASSRAAIGPVTNIILLVIVVSLMGLVYLTQVTKTYALGYKVDALQKQQASLTQQHTDLELESVKLQAIDHVKNSPVAAAMTSVSPSAYAQ